MPLFSPLNSREGHANFIPLHEWNRVTPRWLDALQETSRVLLFRSVGEIHRLDDQVPSVSTDSTPLICKRSRKGVLWASLLPRITPRDTMSSVKTPKEILMATSVKASSHRRWELKISRRIVSRKNVTRLQIEISNINAGDATKNVFVS